MVLQLYFCDVTILTLGFGDVVPKTNGGRGLVFPYSVGGIIMLGLVISSISKFASELSEDNVVRKHIDHIRTRTIESTVTDPSELYRLQSEQALMRTRSRKHLSISAPFNRRKNRTVGVNPDDDVPRRASSTPSMRRHGSIVPVIHKRTNLREAVRLRGNNRHFRLLREERDRFNEMRRLEHQTTQFKRWWALTLSVCAFSTLWLVGAAAIWQAEKHAQGMSYFEGLYFCYVSLLTIGYGDFSPQSCAGRAFFVVWSLVGLQGSTFFQIHITNVSPRSRFRP
jgi:potassium channel subfamily K